MFDPISQLSHSKHRAEFTLYPHLLNLPQCYVLIKQTGFSYTYQFQLVSNYTYLRAKLSVLSTAPLELQAIGLLAQPQKA